MFGCDLRTGGESGIRTHVTLSSKHAFQACAFSHSAISPATKLLQDCALVGSYCRDLQPTTECRHRVLFDFMAAAAKTARPQREMLNLRNWTLHRANTP